MQDKSQNHTAPRYEMGKFIGFLNHSGDKGEKWLPHSEHTYMALYKWKT